MVVGKKTLKDYGFNEIEDYYSYIVESEINGQYKQMKDLFNKLNREQKKSFLDWVDYMGIANISIGDLL